MSFSEIAKAVIPAAGQGTRFLPATKASPKEMLPLVDKPILQYIVEETVAAGVRNIIIWPGRGRRAIEDHLDLSYEWEHLLEDGKKEALLKKIRRISGLAPFSYVRQRERRGRGDAVLCARHLIGEEPFV